MQKAIDKRLQEGMYPVRQVKDLKDILNSSAELFGERTAYLYKERLGGEYLPVSFRQVRDDVNALGTALMDEGLSGLHIGVIGENRYEWVITTLPQPTGWEWSFLWTESFRLMRSLRSWIGLSCRR